MLSHTTPYRIIQFRSVKEKHINDWSVHDTDVIQNGSHTTEKTSQLTTYDANIARN